MDLDRALAHRGRSMSATCDRPARFFALRIFGSNAVAGLRAVVRAPRPPARRPSWPPLGWLVLGSMAAIVAIGAVMMLVDGPSYDGVRRLPAALVAVFEVITKLGQSGWFLYPLGILLLLIAAVDRATAPRLVRGVLRAFAVRLGFLFTAIAVPGLFVAVIKRLIGRARPWSGRDPWSYQLLVWQPEYASLPSGHATTAFAAAIAIGTVWPKARPVMWCYALLIAASRIIVSAHHPSDVVAGAIVGTIGALLVRNWYAARRLGFLVSADGTVHRMPGPSWRRTKQLARVFRPWSKYF
jgi:membrane-associated phospholipid phosphatase